MHKVLHFFVDLQDQNHPYNAGDVFPREGLQVSDERLAELSGPNNRQRKPLIAPAEDAPEKAPAKRRTKKADE